MVRCPVLTDEYVGSDSASICRRAVARKLGIECPKQIRSYCVSSACFSLQHIMHRPDGSHMSSAEIDAKLFKKENSCGDGKPGSRIIRMGGMLGGSHERNNPEEIPRRDPVVPENAGTNGRTENVPEQIQAEYREGNPGNCREIRDQPGTLSPDCDLRGIDKYVNQAGTGAVCNEVAPSGSPDRDSVPVKTR